MISDEKTKLFIKNKLLKSSNLNPIYEKQLKHLLDLLNDYDEKSEKTTQSSSSSSSLKLFKKTSIIVDISKQLSKFPITSRQKNPSTYSLPQKKSSSYTDLPLLLDRLTTKKIKVKSPSRITAKSWCIFEPNSAKFLNGELAHSKREVASLTKMMTLYVALSILERLDLDSKALYLTVTREASFLGGTSADLEEGNLISIEDLFYGVMLPSGNDAAFTIGEYFGAFLYLERLGKAYKIKEYMDIDLKKDFKEIGDSIQYFIKEMNITAQEMNLTKTIFNNVHGMSMKLNISSAFDMGILTCNAIKKTAFRKICKTTTYFGKIWNKENSGFTEIFWENTNKLLGQGFEGVKTGVTPNAGPCLSALYRIEKTDLQENFIVVVVLNCENIQDRFDDVKKIVSWCKSIVFK